MLVRMWLRLLASVILMLTGMLSTLCCNAIAARNDRTLIFVDRKKQADFLASLLSQSEYPCTSIHG